MNRRSWALQSAFLFPVILAAVSLLPRATDAASANVKVSVVSDSQLGPPARHGIGKIVAALEARGITPERAASLEAARGDILIVAGLAAGAGPAAQLLKTFAVPPPDGREALVIRQGSCNGKAALLVCGADDRGLMYAALDVADRIGWATAPQNPLSEVRDIAEKPAVADRALSIYTMHRKYFENRLHDEQYWARYFDTLARHRFNRFVIVFGYENGGYMAPPYPYFFDVEEFPDVKVTGLSKEQQERNLKALNRLIDVAHERGLEFTPGIWDHIYRGGVQTGGVRSADEDARKPTAGLVWGVTEQNLVPYTKAALAKFLKLVPNIDSIQFRMHGESGLKKAEMDEFWKNIYQVVKQHAPNMRFDARAKEFPDSLIDAALDMGVNIRITTKYWMEQMGLPFHPTHIPRQNQRDRRHGYADLLRYPQRYKMHWRLWNGGTARILLWADPDYVRRFAASTHLYDGDGFEINEPLATKMEAQPHDMEPFDLLKPQYRYYDFEFERYWHFYQVFGRLAYNPDTPAEVWQKEFEKRFGPQAAPYVERGLHRASQILPRITAATFPYNRFPTTRGWLEKQRWEDLPAYAKAEGSDTQQFAGFDEQAVNVLEGKESARIRPHQTSLWLAHAAADVLQHVAEAEKRIGEKRNKEFDSTMVDLRILANLALYHSRRIPAGLSYALYQRSHDLNALDDAIRCEQRAVGAWEKLVEAAADVYADDLMMGYRGAGLCGHWRDELAELKKGLTQLQLERSAFQPVLPDEAPAIAHVPIRRAAPDKDLIVRATVGSKSPIARVRLGYMARPGVVNLADMRTTAPFLYQAVIPKAHITADFRYFIDAANVAGKLVTFPREGAENAISVVVTNDNDPPIVIHKPVTRASALKPLRITAQVRDPSGVKWVRLLYRGVTQFEDYKTLPMTPAGEKGLYQAEIPGPDIIPKWDLMYLIEVMDTKGNGRIYPDLEKETPYIIVRLERETAKR